MFDVFPNKFDTAGLIKLCFPNKKLSAYVGRYLINNNNNVKKQFKLILSDIIINKYQ